MDEMQIIGGDDLSTLAGKVCSCDSALCPLRPGCCREISNLHFRSALQSISDTLLGLLIHANECVDPFNDSSFYKTLLLSCFQGLTQTKSLVSKLPSNLISDNLTLQNPLSTPSSPSHFFFLLTLSGTSWEGILFLYLSGFHPSSPGHQSKAFKHVCWHV